MKDQLENTLYDGMINGVELKDIIIKTSYENLDIVPSDPNLAGAEVEISTLDQKELRMKNLFNQVTGEYDYIFIDCPPSLGMISINALAASHSVLIPIQCEYYALEGVSQLMNTVNLVKRGLNNNLEIEGIVLTMYDARTNLSLQVVDEVCRYFREKVYSTIVPRNVRLAEAPSHGQTIEEYDDKSKGAQAYMNLAKEFIEKGKGVRE